jgi:translation elongation factor P/translation initiation factor 5A
MQKYIKNLSQSIVAIQVLLEGGFLYEKWGSLQQCKENDWIVNNNGDVYTIDNESFSLTYRQVSPGHYVKTAPVWAKVATEDGEITTKEGQSSYFIGDYIVFNNEDETDGYCISKDKFESMYQPV